MYLTLVSQQCTNNKYTKWYLAICQNAKSRIKSTTKMAAKREAQHLLGYIEGHHIWPQSLCTIKEDKNSFDNYVFLTAREHFICHWLLTKMIADNRKYKMFQAFACFNQCSDNQQRTVTSHHFQLMKQLASKAAAYRALSFSPERNLKISKSTMGQIPYNKGGTLTKEHKEKLSISRTGKTGANATRHKGIYVTPYGSFDTAKSAALQLNCDITTITRLCEFNNSVPVSRNTKFVSAGKTPAEQGWGFVPKLS